MDGGPLKLTGDMTTELTTVLDQISTEISR